MVLADEIDGKQPSIEAIAALCYEKYKKLPKAGKPTTNEWTVLSAVVQFNALNAELKLVSLGCGTKCLGGTQLCSKGLALNDAHAEVLARRSFCRYLHKQLEYANKNEPSVFNWLESDHLYELQPHLSFHFMSTQTPCGDACIIADAAQLTSEHEGDAVPAKRSRLSVSAAQQVYTGAKLIGNEHADAMQQTVGAIRIKPGRGDRTLSVSCSDKLAKWNVLGVQGALLAAHLREPIYFDTLNFCCASDTSSLERAIYKRWMHSSIPGTHFHAQVPLIRVEAGLRFEYAESLTRAEPTAAGIAWCDVPEKERPCEVVVKGKRQGITKKQLHTPHAALQISRYHSMRQHLQLLQAQPKLLHSLNASTITAIKGMTYNELKLLSSAYQECWQWLKQNYFQQWTTKPSEIKEFKVTEDVA